MSDPEDFNAKVIAEFRANDGKVGGPFEGAPILLLHHVGARTGEARVTPMMYQDLGAGVVGVFASNGGADTNPAWFHNIIANPQVSAEIGSENHRFTARTASEAERNEIWERQKAGSPGFANYEAATRREIPVVILEPTG